MQYNPQVDPDPRLWLDMSEDAQIRIVREYHKSGAPALLKEELHAAFHVMVENQIASREEPVLEAMKRLIGEGLDRHEAVHAVGSVLMEHMFDNVHRGSTGEGAKEMYHKDLAHLSAAEWRKTESHKED